MDSSHLQPEPQSNVLYDGERDQSPRRSSQGYSAATSQVRLKPKSPDIHSLELNTPPSVSQLEAGTFDGGKYAASLQPMDEGLAAWSYVVGAFAMYIVVWGQFGAFIYVLNKTVLISAC